MTVQALKNLNADRLDLDELVGLSAFGRNFQAEFTQLNVEEPEWLGPALRELRREITTRNQDSVDKRLRQLRARQQALKPAAERRTEIEAEIARLEALKA